MKKRFNNPKQNYRTLGETVPIYIWITLGIAGLISFVPIIGCLCKVWHVDFLINNMIQNNFQVAVLDTCLSGLSEFGKEVSKFFLSFVLGYWLIFDKERVRIQRIRYIYLIIVPAVFIYLAAVEKTTHVYVTYLKAHNVSLQGDYLPQSNPNLDKPLLPKGGNP